MKLGERETYRRIKSVDIGPVLAVLPSLQFISVNQSGGKYQCDVVLRDQFPPALKDLVANLGLGGRTARAILRRLGPRQSIPPHVDAWMPKESDWRRFQLPLTTHHEIVMRWPDDGVSVHLEAGALYEVRYDRTHEVIHGADCERTHLQLDVVDATI